MDLEHERAVQKDKIEAYLKNNTEFIYFETSATEGSNVNEVFTAVAKNHLKMKRADSSVNLPDSI